MQQQREQPYRPLDDMRRNLNMLVWASFVWCAPIEVFLRQRFGQRYFGYHLWLGLGWAFLFGTWFPGHDMRPMQVFAVVSGVWAVLLADKRRQLAKKGVVVHTQFSGDSHIPGKQAKTMWEPVLVFAVGCFALPFNQPLGVYLILGALCLGMFHAMIHQREEADRRAVRDALIEADYRQEVMQEERERMGK